MAKVDRRRLFGRWVVAVGVAAALTIHSIQFVVTRREYGDELEAVEAAHARAAPALLHLSAARAAISGVYRDLALVGGHLVEERAAVARLLGRHWPIVDAHMRAYEGVPALPSERAQRQQLEVLLESLRATEPLLLEATTEADARAVLEWQLLPIVGDLVRTFDALAAESGRAITGAGRRLARGHAHADRLSLLLFLAALASVAAAGGVAYAVVARAEGEMHRRYDELDAFAGRVAHDLRGPLQPALLSATLLRSRCPAQAGQLIDRLEHCMRQAAGLVEELLAFARSGAEPDPRARCQVSTVLRDLEPELMELASAERAALAFEAEPDLEVATDATSLRLIVANLVRNALLYLGDARTRDVRVVAERDGARAAVISVSDTGPGIPAELRPRLFLPFQRGSSRPGGSGLGLATVRRLVDAHGGAIDVATRLGAGTTFSVRLPSPRPSRHRLARPDSACARRPDR